MKKITDQELAKFLNMEVRTVNQKLKRNNRSLEKGDYELKSTGKKDTGNWFTLKSLC